MDQRILRVVEQLEARASQESKLAETLPQDEYLQRLDEFLLPIGRQAATFINALIKGVRATRILELGTSYGYSTVWLAEAAMETNGHVISIDSVHDKAKYAQERLEEVELAAHVRLIIGDAIETVKALSGSFDFVLLDLWKNHYIQAFDSVRDKLILGGIIIADNMLAPASTRPLADAYRRHVYETFEFESVSLDIGSGIHLSRYVGNIGSFAQQEADLRTP